MSRMGRSDWYCAARKRNGGECTNRGVDRCDVIAGPYHENTTVWLCGTHTSALIRGAIRADVTSKYGEASVEMIRMQRKDVT
jgi:hypothetical protein